VRPAVGAALLLPRAGAMDTELHLRAGEDARELDSAGRCRSLKACPPSAVVDPLSSKAERRGGGQRELAPVVLRTAAPSCFMPPSC
jgi:hypothetical protein